MSPTITKDRFILFTIILGLEQNIRQIPIQYAIDFWDLNIKKGKKKEKKAVKENDKISFVFCADVMLLKIYLITRNMDGSEKPFTKFAIISNQAILSGDHAQKRSP